MSYFTRLQAVHRRKRFSAAVTGIPSAQLYVNNVEEGGAIAGVDTGDGKEWEFEVTIPNGVDIGSSIQCVATATVGGQEEKVDVFEGSVVGVTSTSEFTDAIVAAVTDNALSISIVSPYDPVTGVLTLVQRADYTETSLQGRLRFTLGDADVQDGDTVRFGATKRGQSPISVTGVVSTENGVKWAAFVLTKETDTDRKAGDDWMWELEHISAQGDVSPLAVDQPMILKPSHADPSL